MVPLSYKRPNPTSQYKTVSNYTGGTEFFSCVKMPTQDLLRIPMYYILKSENYDPYEEVSRFKGTYHNRPSNQRI